MPRPKSTAPAYQFHVSGQAVVRLDGKDFYLGKHGTPESYARYYALLAEYNANGMKAPDAPPRMAEVSIRIKDITADFRNRVLPRFEKNNAQHNRFDKLLELLEQRHGDEAPEDFGPRKLEALRDHFAAQGCSRSYCNTKTRYVIRIFKHGVARELAPAERLTALESLEPLRKGDGRETVKRAKVTRETIQATLPHLSPTVQAMVRLQLATAMRPSEVCRMTPAMIDKSGAVWMYRPESHKTAHHGKSKAVPILGDALAALTPFLFGDENELCFQTVFGTPWNKDSYRIAVTRAAKAAKVPHWTPYALRHATAQDVRDIAGPEAAQALLCHSRLSTVEIYAQVNEQKAIEAAKVVPKLR
jgi:integrase